MGCGRNRAGFTLAEVLAALVFMAIVIPTAIQGLRVASMAGEMGMRKSQAAQIAERELNELLVTRQWMTSAPRGTVQEGSIEYQWSMRTDPWNPMTLGVMTGVNTSTAANVLRLLTVQVDFPIQGKDYTVELSTVVDPSQQQ